MTDKEIYKQKYQAQLDEWKAEIDKLKAKAKSATADARLDMEKLIAELDDQWKHAMAKFSELGAASETAWDSVKKNAEAAWESLSQAVSNASKKFKS